VTSTSTTIVRARNGRIVGGVCAGSSSLMNALGPTARALQRPRPTA
jgi:hypothetical protein